ncbi:hypothetical protein BV22DRAFT_172025 [Leucogyrophana mollusca]|uniref:Uncharacterized protein n=1 Tax=Leucogyrophana mollusca TaxID=85980 RepID=A0ACB8BSC9_9AGAM|nr:hypothetical protein BV22DRAFT_172025 [Leucogyrophana mollusca]
MGFKSAFAAFFLTSAAIAAPSSAGNNCELTYKKPTKHGYVFDGYSGKDCNYLSPELPNTTFWGTLEIGGPIKCHKFNSSFSGAEHKMQSFVYRVSESKHPYLLRFYTGTNCTGDGKVFFGEYIHVL